METFDESRKCPQDGGISTNKYHSEDYGCEIQDQAHMHRTCNKCGYEWVESPKV